MANGTVVTVLTPVTGISQLDPAAEFKIVFSALERTDALLDRLRRERQAEAAKLAASDQFTKTEVEKFNFDSFVSQWKPIEEKFNERKSTLEAYRSALEDLRLVWKTERTEKLCEFLTEERERLVGERKTTDDALDQKIVEIDILINELKCASAAAPAAKPLATGEPKQLGSKK